MLIRPIAKVTQTPRLMTARTEALVSTLRKIRLVMQRQWHDHERADNQHGEPGEARRRQVEPGERGAGGGGLGAWRHRSRDHERSPERGPGAGSISPTVCP